MDVRFKHNPAQAPDKVYFEQVFAEKPGGGLVANPDTDVPPTTAVGESDGKFVPIKAYRLIQDVAKTDTSISIEKGSGVAKGDFIATGKTAVKCTAVNTTAADKDVVTVTLGVDLTAGTVLYQAKEASTDTVEAEPIMKPVFVTGNWVYAGDGDQPVRLVNGANVRKETANIASEVATLLPMITLV